ncbi:MAG: thioredoxin domain-containing protein [Patescibacteria group bacterium]|nr:thioredoxin domain-containing protein [Patescibacteria group bacterium]
MKKKYKLILSVLLAIIFITALSYFLVSQNNKPGKLDDFAKCLQQQDATFYGAFWCSHCKEQKAEFGKSAKYLPYVECSTSDSNGQLPVCTNQKIESYPTWIFADGTRQLGKISLTELASKTSCELPK